MEADFEGSLHDMEVDRNNEGSDDDDQGEEGDEERLDQQMGDTGDNDQVGSSGVGGSGVCKRGGREGR
jgi:midasin